MAEVYDGYDERLHRPVAIKVLRPEATADPDIRHRFEVEARSAAGLSHPNVVAVFDTGEDAGTPFIVMERLPGETLADRMAAGPVDQAWVRRVAGDVLGALGAAHAAGIVHRDIKPGNILLADDGCAKVADFGIAKSMEVGRDITGTGLLVGTPAYLAPERIEGRDATARSDLYALGVVLYEALAGVKPFGGNTSVAVAEAVLHTPFQPLLAHRPDIDPALAGAVEQAMARNPDNRPNSAREMRAAIEGRRPASPVVDPTVALDRDPKAADPTLVGALPLAVAAPRLAEGETGGPTARAGLRRWLSTPVGRGVLVACALVLVLLLVAVARDGDSTEGIGDAALAAQIHDLAQRVEVGDGPAGPGASERLEKVAEQVEAGGGADEANALLTDAAQWEQAGELSAAAAQEIASLLRSVEGVDPILATSTTVATLPATTVAPPANDDEDDGGRKGKGRKERD